MGNPIVDLGAYEYVGIPYFLGACCMADGMCIAEMEEVVCENYDGVWQGGATECAFVECSVPCPADLTGVGNIPDGVVDVSDLFRLLANWNTNGPGANLAPPNDIVNVSNLFALLAAWGMCE